jgi:hypothetical protein
MMIVLIAPLFLLAVVALQGLISRLIGVGVLALFAGLTWSTAVIGCFDLLLFMGVAALARRLGLPNSLSADWVRRVAAVFSGLVCLEFGAFALLIANRMGGAVDALPFDLGMLLCGLALAALLRRRQTRSGAVSLVSASAQA